MSYETILTEKRGRVLLITLNRPEALNALNRKLAGELLAATLAADADPDIGCLVITGSAKAFAAGADIKEMQAQNFTGMHATDWFAEWERFAAARKPKIAAVAGYALGGGCELALMCDFILAADSAKFGQPEIKLGVIPGMGGSQRLVRSIGKSKAMELCLTGRMMDSAEAERCGLASRIIPAADLVEEAVKTADAIANMSLTASMLMKEAINQAYELPLASGLTFERRVFHALFSTDDQKEGMAAFVEKRPAQFNRG